MTRGSPLKRCRQCVEVVVDPALLVVEEHDLFDVGVARQFDGVLRRGVSEVGLGRQLLAQELRVVDEHVGVLTQ